MWHEPISPLPSLQTPGGAQQRPSRHLCMRLHSNAGCLKTAFACTGYVCMLGIEVAAGNCTQQQQELPASTHQPQSPCTPQVKLEVSHKRGGAPPCRTYGLCLQQTRIHTTPTLREHPYLKQNRAPTPVSQTVTVCVSKQCCLNDFQVPRPIPANCLPIPTAHNSRPDNQHSVAGSLVLAAPALLHATQTSN